MSDGLDSSLRDDFKLDIDGVKYRISLWQYLPDKRFYAKVRILDEHYFKQDSNTQSWDYGTDLSYEGETVMVRSIDRLKNDITNKFTKEKIESDL